MISAITPTRRRSRPRAISPAPSGTGRCSIRASCRCTPSGKTIPNFVRGGLKEGFVKISPYGPTVSDAARKQADDVKAKLTAGAFVIFKGPLKDNKGNTVIAAGVDRGQTDPELESMNYLVEGVIGATVVKADVRSVTARQVLRHRRVKRHGATAIGVGAGAARRYVVIARRSRIAGVAGVLFGDCFVAAVPARTPLDALSR